MWFSPLSNTATGMLELRVSHIIEVVSAGQESGSEWLEQLIENVSFHLR